MGEEAPAPDGSWCDRLAEALAAAAAADVALLTPRLRGRVLAAAREVAHATERRNAPVAAFVAGRYVEARQAQGIDADTAFSEVLEVVTALLPRATP